jgi:hypothetical protein
MISGRIFSRRKWRLIITIIFITTMALLLPFSPLRNDTQTSAPGTTSPPERLCDILSYKALGEVFKLAQDDFYKYTYRTFYSFPPPGPTSVHCDVWWHSDRGPKLLNLQVEGRFWEDNSPGSPYGDWLKAIDSAPDLLTLSRPGVRSGAAKGKGAYYIKPCSQVDWTVIKIRSAPGSAGISAADWIKIIDQASSYLDSLGPCRSAGPTMSGTQSSRH